MIERLPFIVGMSIAQAAALWSLALTHPGSNERAAAAAAATVLAIGSLTVAAISDARAQRLLNAASGAIGALALGVTYWVWWQLLSTEVLGWGLAAIQVAANLRVRTRRETLFALLCSLGILIIAITDLWGASMLSMGALFCTGATLALAARYYLDEVTRSETRPAEPAVRLAAPGIVAFGIVPVFVLAVPLILLQPETPAYPLPFQMLAGGIVHSDPPTTATDRSSERGSFNPAKGTIGQNDESPESDSGSATRQAGGTTRGGKQPGSDGKPSRPDGGTATQSAKPRASAGGQGEEPAQLRPGADRTSGSGPASNASGIGVRPNRDGHASAAPSRQGTTGPGDTPGGASAGPAKGAGGPGKLRPTDQPGQEPGRQQSNAAKTKNERESDRANRAPGKTGADDDTRNGRDNSDLDDGPPSVAKRAPEPEPKAGSTPGEREFPGGVCTPRPKPPRRDVCSFHVLNPYHHPALYRTEDQADASTVLRVRSNSPAYLREQVYDHYQNGTWRCADSGAKSIEPAPGKRYFFSSPEARTSWHGFVSVEKPITDMVPTALRAEFMRFGSSPLQVSADHALKAPSPLGAGTRYYLESVVLKWDDGRPTSDFAPLSPNADYLQIPAGLAPTLARLAAPVANTQYHRYFQGEALERHLRENYQHSLTRLSLRGDEPEPMDDFLVGSRAGNAELFATALVLMARSHAIPARLVVGRVAARKELAAEEFSVHRLDAHAWAELYINETWTTFDPTPFRGVPKIERRMSRRESIVRYLETLDDLAGAFDEIVPDSGLPGTVWESLSTPGERMLVRLVRAARWLYAHWYQVALGLGLVVALLWFLRTRLPSMERLLLERSRAGPRTRVLAAYAALERLGGRRGYRRPASDHHVTYVAGLARVFPHAAAPIQMIGAEFGPARYGNSPVSEAAAARAVGAFGALINAIGAAASPPTPPEGIARPQGYQKRHR